MKITGVDHTSYTVSNLDRSLAFYVDLLGMGLLWRRRIEDAYFCEIVGFPDCAVEAAHLSIPGAQHHLELFEYVCPQGQPSGDLRTMNVGSSHISLLVDGLDELYTELQSKNVRFRSPPVEITHGANRGGRALYLLDPDGIPVELFQPPSRPTRSPNVE